jgi:hypothetical protein
MGHWQIRRLPPLEVFANAFRTPAPVTGYVSRTYGSEEERKELEEDDLSEVEGTVPRTIEAILDACAEA